MSRKNAKVVSIYITDEEEKYILERAKDNKMYKGEYIDSCILSSYDTYKDMKMLILPKFHMKKDFKLKKIHVSEKCMPILDKMAEELCITKKYLLRYILVKDIYNNKDLLQDAIQTILSISKSNNDLCIDFLNKYNLNINV